MNADPLLGKFHGKRLLLDTNLLLPYFVGSYYRVHQQVSRHGAFKEEEFQLLAQIIERFKKVGNVLTTPHILTEVSNLARKMDPKGFKCPHCGKEINAGLSLRLKENRLAFMVFIRSLIQQLDEKFDEKRMGACRLSAQEYFPMFGLADAAIIDLASDRLLILTNDEPMARYLQIQKMRRNVVYFGDLKKRCLSNT